MDISVWRPNLDTDWYYLGQGAESNWDHAPLGIIIHALEPDALRDVVGWERVWDDAGSHKSTDFALWRGIPPNEDYVVVGGIFSTKPDWAEPDSEQKRGIKAIRRNLLVMDDTFQVWNDKGTHASKDGSVWKTWGHSGPSPWALIPMNSHSAPPRDVSFSLDPNKTMEMPGNWSWASAAAKSTLAENVLLSQKEYVEVGRK
ncbi:FDS protein [Mucidula mucida]|nr:FDS protein [Mucidula mucida]